MSRKPEYRNVPGRGGGVIPARLMGEVDGYAMVRRMGAMPFVVTIREWHEAPLCTPEGIAMKGPKS